MPHEDDDRRDSEASNPSNSAGAGPSGRTAEAMTDALANLQKTLSKNLLFPAADPAAWQPRSPIADSIAEREQSALPASDFRPITADIADNTGRMAELLDMQHQAIAELVNLTASNLNLTAEQRNQAQRAERFSRRMTWTSVAIAGASLAAAIVAIVVTLNAG